jgi:hypothetical protein
MNKKTSSRMTFALICAIIVGLACIAAVFRSQDGFGGNNALFEAAATTQIVFVLFALAFIIVIPIIIRYLSKSSKQLKRIAIEFENEKQAAEQKKPIVLFTHIPLYSEELFRIAKNALIAIPDEIVNTFSPFRTFEQRADETTRQCYDFIQGCPYVKAIVSGHLHLPFESSDEGAKKQLVTSLDTLHEITIE